MSTNKLSLDIIERELERLSKMSKTPGVGLNYDEVRMLEILIRTGTLLRKSSEDDPKEQDFSKVTDEDLEHLLHD